MTSHPTDPRSVRPCECGATVGHVATVLCGSSSVRSAPGLSLDELIEISRAEDEAAEANAVKEATESFVEHLGEHLGVGWSDLTETEQEDAQRAMSAALRTYRAVKG